MYVKMKFNLILKVPLESYFENPLESSSENPCESSSDESNRNCFEHFNIFAYVGVKFPLTKKKPSNLSSNSNRFRN